jgi:hypothetical protein
VTVRIERVTQYGENRRRFFLVAEVSFNSCDGDDYYSDDELPGLVEGWVDAALNDRDDSPSVHFYEVPRILDVAMEAIARGDYPKEGH